MNEGPAAGPLLAPPPLAPIFPAVAVPNPQASSSSTGEYRGPRFGGPVFDPTDPSFRANEYTSRPSPSEFSGFTGPTSSVQYGPKRPQIEVRGALSDASYSTLVHAIWCPVT
jgi:hypothetical protein